MKRNIKRPVVNERFDLLPEHVLLLQSAYVTWYDAETGAPAIDAKRPYGNSDVPLDMARILGVSVSNAQDLPAVLARLWTLHAETQFALQIFLVTGQMVPGTYVKEGYGRVWKRADEPGETKALGDTMRSPPNDGNQHPLEMPALKSGDIETLEGLEESLWTSSTRFDREHMQAILAKEFIEFGRSGKTYTRSDCLTVEQEPILAVLPLKDLTVTPLDENNVRVTYISEVTYGNTVEYGKRCSIWSRTDAQDKHAKGWSLRFHQGTPFTP